jgi:hypothetical protein
MIIIRLFFMLFVVFVVLMTAMAVSIWIKVRMHLQNPFLRQKPDSPLRRDDKVIEGEYKVLSEPQKDKSA